MKKFLILFDFGGVIGDDICQEVSRSNFKKDDTKRMKLEKLLMGENWQKFKVGQISEEIYWKMAFKSDPSFWKKELNVSNEDECHEFGVKDFQKTCHIFPETVEIIKNLIKKKNKNIKIGILSNHSKEWFSYYMKTDFNGIVLNDLFKEKKYLYISCDLGKKKPDDDIYQHIIKDNSELDSKNIIFIDNKKGNIDAAIKNGMSALICLLCKKGQT